MANKKEKLKEPVPQNTNRGRKPPQREIERMRAEKLEEEKRKKEKIARVVSIVVFALSIIFFFIAVISGEGLWLILHNAYIGILGWVAAILFPILCLLYSIAYFNVERSKNKVIYETVSIVVAVLLVSAFIHIVLNKSGQDFLQTVGDSYKNAPETFNGGALGGIIGWLFLTCGKAPAVIIDLVLMFVDIMLLTKLSINDLFNKAKDTAKSTVEKVAPYYEEYRERRNNRNIDVPLDKEAPDSAQNNSVSTKSKKKTSDTADVDVSVDDGLGNDAMADMIRDINATTKLNKSKRNPADSVQEHKSIDEIAEDAAKIVEEKHPAANKNDAVNSETDDFVVEDENMQSKVENYKIPPVDILLKAKKKSVKDVSNELKSNAQLLIETLASFGVAAEITDISRGPTVTRYELKPAAGIRISKITNLADDIALNLAATNVRIEAPIPGKSAIGIEIPNTVTNMVSMRELIDTPDFAAQKSILSAGIGKDIAGKTVYCDIAKMPHLLIAGTTGSGKSVCMNSIIVSILYRATPDEVKLLMIDPKKVEFSKYENIPHLLVPVVTDPRKASGALGWAVSEMLKRYQAFSDNGVRDIEGYNKYAKKHDLQPMPKVVICIDELADLMMAAPKEVEDSICRLAQMARAAGMHLVIATQRPSVDVITGLIKANISSRIALTVSSQIDSRTILDTGGAEKLLGRGDMLYSPIGSSKPLRVQGCFISDEEVEELCNFIKDQGESRYSEEIQKEIETKTPADKNASPFVDGEKDGESLDPLFEKAVDVVLDNGRASTSFLQRKLGVGYSRGSKIMDQLEEKGIIGQQDGAKPREIRINKQQWIQMQAMGSAPEDSVDFTNDNTEQISFDIESASSAQVVDNQYFSAIDDIEEEKEY